MCVCVCVCAYTDIYVYTYLRIYIYCVMFTVVGNGHGDPSSNPVRILYSAYTFRKGMNLTILPSAIGK